VVNVVTKTGSNEFHGSVFANVQALQRGRRAGGRRTRHRA
jgi:outer membrane receptor for ferrienterochelin and colicin